METNHKTREKRKISKVKILTLVMVFILFCTGTVFLFIGLYGIDLLNNIEDVDSTDPNTCV